MYRIKISAVCVSIFSAGCLSNLSAAEFHVAFWNVENLFDTEDDPTVALDEDFTPQSPKRWTPERLETKLNNLSSILRKLNAGRGPDVFGLCEVENRGAVEMLVAKLAPLGRKYEIVHRDSPSDRGIDCALVYDAAVFTLAETKFHFVDAEKTRDIVEATLRHEGAELRVFVNHWPSRNNDEWQRIKAARVLRGRIDEILATDPHADFVLIGDFNDEPDNISLKEHLRSAVRRADLSAGSLFDTTAYLPVEQKGTYVWDNQWELIDHILVSPGLMDQAGFRWKTDSSRRVEFPELFYHSRRAGVIPRPSRSYSENNFHERGYSDHLPVECLLAK
jgi:endonuclease/exonuclease/phosphatase family metal-dependent hydrolase